MTEESPQAPAEPDVQDKPEPQAPQVDKPEVPEVNFDEKFDPSTLPEELQPVYGGMRKAYTQKTQELAERRQQIEQAQSDLELLEGLRNDPDAQRAFFNELVEAYGIDALNEWIPDDEEGQDDNPLKAFESRIEAIETAEAQRAAQAQAAELEAQLNREIDTLAESQGVKFTEDERELLLDTTVTAMLQTNQPPNVAEAHKRLKAAEKAWQERYLASKNPGSSPAPTGQSGSPDIDLSDSEKRVQRGIAVLQAQRESG